MYGEEKTREIKNIYRGDYRYDNSQKPKHVSEPHGAQHLRRVHSTKYSQMSALARASRGLFQNPHAHRSASLLLSPFLISRPPASPDPSQHRILTPSRAQDSGCSTPFSFPPCLFSITPVRPASCPLAFLIRFLLGTLFCDRSGNPAGGRG